MSAAAIVLAAGLGTRFGAAKMLAPFAGRPLLQHVLDALAATRLEQVVVVLGRDAERVDAAITWRNERRLRNRRPERGISGSLRLGLAALAEVPAVEHAVVVLGDQPLVTPTSIEALLRTSRHEPQPIVVPRYADGRPGNPVLLGRAAWPLAGGLTGDRGMSALFGSRPELVRYLDLAGDNPDVDTAADLAELNRAAAPARSARREAAGRSRP